MLLDKTQYETSLDLSLYIEGLLNPAEPELEIKVETEFKHEIEELKEEVVPKLEVSHSEIETDTSEQAHIPLWGQDTFECLIVKSAGMNLMLPAMSVSYIEKINKNIIRLPLEAEAFRGVLTLRNRSVSVIDLFSMISESTAANNQGSNQVNTHHIEHVIVMENGNYALACDGIGELVKLTTEDVRWNKASFNNPMFAGIVTEHLCPIVNIDNVQQQVAAMPFVQSLNNNY